MIVTRALTKRYGAVTAVQAVDLDVREGDRYGLLGPNGSGKTTLVRMLLGLVYATSGEIEVLGQRIPRHVREVLLQRGTTRSTNSHSVKCRRELVEQPRLADACLTFHEDEGKLPSQGRAESLAERGQLSSPA